MQRVVVFSIALVLAIATIEAQQTKDPDAASNAGNVTILGALGYEYEVTQSDGVEPNTHLQPRNINISSEDWNSIRDSVLLRVQGKNADSAGTQGFGVVACDRASSDDVAHISLMRVSNPREVVTSTNDSAGGGIVGNIARTAPRARPEGKSETLYAVLTAPFLNGVIDAGWQIASGGYRTLSVSVQDTFNNDGSAPVIAFSIGCGQSIYPF
jgi:hypothetical protein